MLEALFARFDSIIVFDIETTGIDHKGDEIIELAALQMEMGPLGAPVVRDEFDLLIRLSDGRALPEEIVKLTGITPEQLAAEGVAKATAASSIVPNAPTIFTSANCTTAPPNCANTIGRVTFKFLL